MIDLVHEFQEVVRLHAVSAISTHGDAVALVTVFWTRSLVR